MIDAIDLQNSTSRFHRGGSSSAKVGDTLQERYLPESAGRLKTLHPWCATDALPHNQLTLLKFSDVQDAGCYFRKYANREFIALHCSLS